MNQNEISAGTLSVCMIVKNEEAFLGRCLQSVRNHVDEIIIVDTGSTDGTIEIAASYGARIYHHPWENDFSKHRNQSLSYASGRWIFIIDADEEFIASSRRGLREELALAEHEGVDALSMRVESSQSNGTETVCSDSIRLFRANGRIRYEGIVHNQLRGYEKRGVSLGRIVHYGYDQGRESMQAKFERTATLLKKQIAENPENAGAHMYLSCSYASVERHEESLREALAAVDLVEAQQITSGQYVRAYCAAIRPLVLAKRFAEAEEIIRRARSRFGEHVDILAAQAGSSFEKQDWARVIETGKRYREKIESYRNFQSEPEMVHISSYGDEWRICAWMGTAELNLGNPDSAEALFSQAREISPDKASLCRHAGVAFAETGRLSRARFYLDEAYRLSGANRDSKLVEALFKMALLTGDGALRERSIRDALHLPGETADWLAGMADSALNFGDRQSALRLRPDLAVDIVQPGTGDVVISACLMVKNEESMLPRCLASIKDQVDEIVVIDTGSTDGTVAIAEGFNAKIYHHPWQEDFSFHRNQSISHAHGRWILIIDADEEYRPSSQRSLRDELALADRQGIEALSLRVENSARAGKELLCDDSIRVFRANGQIHYEGIVHNNLVGFKNHAASLGGIIHYGYDQGPEVARKKFERTTTLLRKQIEANPENAIAHLYLSVSFASMGRHEDALREALTTVELVEAQDITNKQYVKPYYFAVRSHILARRYDEADGLCRRALDRFGGHIDIFAAETEIRFEKKDWDGVIETGSRYRDSLEQYRNRKHEPVLMSISTYGDEWKICAWMGTAKLELGDPEGAQALFTTALDMSPEKASFCRYAGIRLFAAARPDYSRFYLEESRRLSLPAIDSAVVEALFKIALLTGDAALAARSVNDARSLPGVTTAWLTTLADFATSRGDGQTALALLMGIVAVDDSDISARLKIARILVLHNMIEEAVTQCDALLRLLALPRDRALASLADLAGLFRVIAAALEERRRCDAAAIAMAIADRLTPPANQQPDRHELRGSRPKISLCMIVKNESGCLPRCLASVRPLVDEIVVVDTGSTDKTPDTARQLGARVFNFDWNDDFSTARNFALSKVTGEWTLILDADEVIAGRDLDRIKTLVQNDQGDAYRFILRNYVNDAHFANALPNPNDYQEGAGYPGFIPASLIRLFRTGSDVRFTGAVHETLDASFINRGKTVLDSKIPIHHYGKVITARIEKKKAFYTRLGISKMMENPRDPMAYKALADQYLELDMPDQALEVAEKGLYLFPDFAELHFDKGLALERSGRPPDAADAYREAIERDNHHVGAYNNLAGILMNLGRHEAALKVLQGASGTCMNHPVFCYTLGLIHSVLDNHSEALKYFDKTLKLSPGFKKVNNQKAIVFLKRNECDQAAKCLEQEIEIKGDMVPALITLGEINLRRNDSLKASHYFQEVLLIDPDNAAAGNYLERIARERASS